MDKLVLFRATIIATEKKIIGHKKTASKSYDDLFNVTVPENDFKRACDIILEKFVDNCKADMKTTMGGCDFDCEIISNWSDEHFPADNAGFNMDKIKSIGTEIFE